MRKKFLCFSIFLFMLISYSCVTPRAIMNQNIVTLPKQLDYTGHILEKSGKIVGSLNFLFEVDSSFFYLKIKTDMKAVAEVMDPEFEGMKFIKVSYQPIESEFEGKSVEGDEKCLRFISKINDQGLIAIVILTIDKQNNYSGQIDIRTEEFFKQVLLVSQMSKEGGGISPFTLYILERDARFVGKFLIKPS